MTFDEFMNLSEGDRYRYFMTLDGAERDAHVNDLAARGLNITGGQLNSTADADNTDLTFGGESGRNPPEPAPDYSDQLSSLYNQLLGRDIRQTGLDYWSNDLANGASIDDVRANIMLSQEYSAYQNAQNSTPAPPPPPPPPVKTGYDRVSDVRINNLYNELFGRNARDTGLDYWGDWSERYDSDNLRKAIIAGANRDGEDYQWYYNNVVNEKQGATNTSDWDDPYLGVGPNEPVNDPGRTPGAGGGYNWNWEDFQAGAPDMEGGGGYDPNDYAFDRYVPGQESPWGVPDIEGGNKDFYRNQMVSLLRDEQNFRDRQRESDAIRQGSDPLEPTPMDWSWLEGGLPEVRVGGGADDWRQNDGYAGLNNLQALDQLRAGGDISKSTYDWFRGNWGEDDNNASWLTGNTDYQGLSGMGQQPWERAAYQDVANGLYENFGDNPGIAPGYAAPVAGYNPTRNASGPAASYYNPFTGGWQAPGVQVPGVQPPGGGGGGPNRNGPGQDKK